MAEDYGSAYYIESRLLDKYLLLCQSPRDANSFYLFQRQSMKRRQDGTCTTYFRCVRCLKISSNNPSSNVVRNERVLRDPSVGHYDNCIPYSALDIEVLKTKRGMRRRVLNDGLRPLDAYREAVEELRNHVNDSKEFDILLKQIGGYKQHRSSLYRCAMKFCEITGTTYEKRFGNGRSSSPRRPGGQFCSPRSLGPQMQAGEGQHQPITGQLPRNYQPTVPEDEASFAVQNLEEPIAQLDAADPARHQFTRTSVQQQARLLPASPRVVHRRGTTGPSQIMLNGMLRSVRAIPGPPPIANAAASQGDPSAIPARSVVSTLTRALAMCRKKTRWETFGDYVGKTLESLPETNARRVSREIQRLLDAEQDDVEDNGHT